MKTTIYCIIFIVFGFSSIKAQDSYITPAQLKPKERPTPNGYKITLSTERSNYSLGEPIIVTVKYYNGSKMNWELFLPDSTAYNSIAYRNELWSDNERWNRGDFNTFEILDSTRMSEESAYGMPIVGRKIIIKPNDKYIFKTDILDKYDLWYFLSGLYKINYSDYLEKIHSDTIKVCVHFTPKSIDYLLEILVNEKRFSLNIRWAKQLLCNFDEDIKKYEYGACGAYMHEITYTPEQKINNEKIISYFRAYWVKNKDTEETKAKIHKINTDFSKYYDFMSLRRAKQLKDCCDDVK